MMNEHARKVFIFSFPFVGHTNPVLGFCNKLREKNKNIEIIIYSRPNFKTFIENAGAQFRDYDIEMRSEDESPTIVNELNIFRLALKTVDFANKVAKRLCDDVLRDRPDMILYDKSTVFARLSIDFILNEYKKRNLKPFKLVRYVTTFLMDRHYPNSQEKKLLKLPVIAALIFLATFMLKKFIFYVKHGVYNRSIAYSSTFDPLDNETTMIFTFPELQPRGHLRDKNIFKFVGCSFDEKLHATSGNNLVQQSNDVLNQLPIRIDSSKTEYDLIYVAFGTILTNQIDVYLRIIKALKLVNEERPIKVIIATGTKCYGYLTEKYDIPPFIHLMKSAPQIDILKKASLFITHNGMNSTSESIHFGVPMLCLPMTTDQPLVAYRVADELGLGLRLNFKTADIKQLKDAVVKMLTDSIFREKCLVYKDYSRNYDGITNSANLIYEILNK